MTKREMFETIATLNADNAEIVEFCNHEIELLNKRATSKRGMTKTQKENEGVKAIIADALAENGGVTISELIANNVNLAGFSNQKVSALVNQMVKAGTVAKTIEGKKALFTLV